MKPLHFAGTFFFRNLSDEQQTYLTSRRSYQTEVERTPGGINIKVPNSTGKVNDVDFFEKVALEGIKLDGWTNSER